MPHGAVAYPAGGSSSHQAADEFAAVGKTSTGTTIAPASPMTEALGWASSIVLLATIFAQIAKQWRERTVRGVSKWLFIGQTAASVGFTIYSALLENWVFTITNGLLLISAIVGCVLTFRFRQAAAARPSSVSAA